MSIIQQYNYTENPVLGEILKVLDEGLKELKQNTDDFVTLPDPYRIPSQYLEHLTETLGLYGITGVTDYDRRAVLTALGYAYHFKGSNHGLRMILRALWRYAYFVEDYKDILEIADVSGVTSIAEWPAFLTSNALDTQDLTRVTIYADIDLEDSRRYGELQAGSYEQLLEIVKQDSGYERLLRTYRPGFDADPSTLLGTSQFDGVSVFAEQAFFLYGRNRAFLDESTQSILASLRWEPYPGVKLARTHRILEAFIPLIVHLRFVFNRYKIEDTVLVGSADSVTVTSTP